MFVPAVAASELARDTIFAPSVETTATNIAAQTTRRPWHQSFSQKQSAKSAKFSKTLKTAGGSLQSSRWLC